jgi:hypothetical protein
MTDPQYTPDSLADELDKLLSSHAPQASSEDDPLMQMAARLRNAPQPAMSPQAMSRIRRQILQAHQQQVGPPRRQIPRWTQWATAISAVVALTLVVLSITIHQSPISATLPLSPAPTLRTSVPEVNPLAPTSPPQPTDIVATPSDSPMPEATESFLTTITIQGPIEAINGNVITIYGIDLEIDPKNPLLETLRVGDIVQIEGDASQTTASIVVLTPSANGETYSNNQGQVWRDDGNCDNPPPSWAQANGWHRRCDGRSNGQGNGSGNPGSGNGNGNGNGGQGRGN